MLSSLFLGERNLQSTLLAITTSKAWALGGSIIFKSTILIVNPGYKVD